MQKMVFAFAAFMLLFSGLSTAQNALDGKWLVYMDNNPEAGALKGKEVGIVEFKKDPANGKYYELGVETHNNYNTNCTNCKGTAKNKAVVGSRWSENLQYNPTTGQYEGGTGTDPQTGKVFSVVVKVVNSTTLEVTGTDDTGAKRTLTYRKKA